MQEFDGQEDARALWITGAGHCELQDERLASPARDEAIVESLCGAISRGTERLVFEGRVPPGEYERMRGPNQAGKFPFPVKYGYAVVGRVAAGPDAVLGQTVFCLHPHQDRFVAKASDLLVLPEGLSPARAVLGANMETALNIVWDAGVAPGDRIGVVGGGLVGLLTASLAARIPGVEATIIDVDPGRQAVADALGLAFETPEQAKAERDVVVHCSASADGLATAIAIAGTEARIVEASWYGAGETRVPLGGAFHARRLSIVASQVGAVPPPRRARWSNRRRLEKALSLLAEDRLDALFSGETLFSQLPEQYAGILSSAGTLCHRIRYS